MKNRNLFILVVAILLFITFAASTSALILSGMREDSPEVSVVIDDSGSGRWTTFISGLEQAAKDNNIKLTTSDIKTIMKETAITDSYTNGTNASHFGNGKIDALAGINQKKYCLVTDIRYQILCSSAAVYLIYNTIGAT